MCEGRELVTKISLKKNEQESQPGLKREKCSETDLKSDVNVVGASRIVMIVERPF